MITRMPLEWADTAILTRVCAAVAGGGKQSRGRARRVSVLGCWHAKGWLLRRRGVSAAKGQDALVDRTTHKLGFNTGRSMLQTRCTSSSSRCNLQVVVACMEADEQHRMARVCDSSTIGPTAL